MTMIKVQRMPQTIRLEGKTYGPSETPIDVPEELARALGLTPVEGDVLSDASEDELTEALSEAQDSVRRYQNRLVGIETLLRPVQQDESSPEEVIQRLVRESEEGREPSAEDLFNKTITDDAKRLLAPLRQGQETLTEVLARVVQERGDLDAKTREAHEELNRLKPFVQESERILLPFAGEGGQEEDGLGCLRRLTTELTERRAAQSGTGLPTDALDRLKKVDGIGDKLAQKALDALTAQA
ncbi:hypothetical protein [Deinococcus sp. ME38]|uniref:hypothetical protein n=1 Tax=Deinococcus sp. ME38 TaxID=3400344 RepID=UPI003B5BF610